MLPELHIPWLRISHLYVSIYFPKFAPSSLDVSCHHFLLWTSHQLVFLNYQNGIGLIVSYISSSLSFRRSNLALSTNLSHGMYFSLSLFTQIGWNSHTSWMLPSASKVGNRFQPNSSTVVFLRSTCIFRHFQLTSRKLSFVWNNHRSLSTTDKVNLCTKTF